MSTFHIGTVHFRRSVVACSTVIGCAAPQAQEDLSQRLDLLSPTFVQVNSAVPQTAQPQVSQTFALAQTAGNLNVAVVGWQDTRARITSVTDSSGNLYRLAIGPTRQSNRLTQSIYYASNIEPAAPGSNTVSIGFSIPARYIDLRIVEYAGVAAEDPLDGTVGASGNSITSSSGTMSTRNPNDLLVAANVVTTSTASADPNFTSRIVTSPNADIVQDRLVTSAGAYTATARLTRSGPWVMQMAAFRASPSSGSGSGGAAGTGGTRAVGGAAGTGGSRASGGTNAAGGASSDSALPAGWLYTAGNKTYVSDGNGGGSVWVGRGVNVDDIFFCGYNAGLWMTDAEGTFITMIDGLMNGWKPDFLRVSLGMQTYDTISWTANTAQYRTAMTNIVNHIGTYPNTYVLLVLRTEPTMSYVSASNDATYYPSATTDPTYISIVDTFANASYVAFAVANEPGGNSLSNAQIRSAMAHAVETIRAEEDRLGVPHHLIAVQGNSWTSDISYYATNPLPYDNIVYEVHGYPPAARDYTYGGLPVIIGEYGPPNSNTSDTAFFSAFAADLEAKQIPNLAWDFEPFSNCSPDLLNVTRSATNLQPNSWGVVVRDYLLAHAR